MSRHGRIPVTSRWLLVLALLGVMACYWPGLYGGWLFDDYPNIVDNKGVQPTDIRLPSLVNAALSSPASEFKRPLASLSFAANYLVTGLDPFWMKMTNLLIHVLNGVLVFLLSRALMQYATGLRYPCGAPPSSSNQHESVNGAFRTPDQISQVAVAISAAWMLLPINLTAVLYVVQRMESLANLFVLIGLIGYLHGRRLMLDEPGTKLGSHGLALCLASITVSTIIGVLGKETAVMLPLYALLMEWCIFRFRPSGTTRDTPSATNRWSRPIVALFALTIALPLVAGLAYLLPRLLEPGAWATRDFTMRMRLLSEARVVADYIGWTILPTSSTLSFYHDDFNVSAGLLQPWVTLASLACLAAMAMLALWLRSRRPLATLGISLFFGGHLLTGTILPLELIYEHRNYFASFGLLLALVPLLIPSPESRPTLASSDSIAPADQPAPQRPLTWIGHGLAWSPFTLLMVWWAVQTSMTAYAWGDALRLARELAARAPESPRAQYELGRTYIIYSHNDPASPYTRLAYAPLERAAALPKSSILPQQALIFMNSRMGLPQQESWWDSLTRKLEAQRPGVQDESSLAALAQCAQHGECQLSEHRMQMAFEAAMTHPSPSGRLLATYGNYAWNVLGNQELGESLTERAVEASPNESAYRITLIRMLIALNRIDAATIALKQLEGMNVGSHLSAAIASLRSSLPANTATSATLRAQ